MSTMIQVTEPTMVLNEEVCKSNIARMAAKAKAANVVCLLYTSDAADE